MIARRFIVKGRVQGVGFRYFTVRAARSIGVAGAVKNLPDGSVEAIAEGSPEDIARFKEALEHGPSYSHVTSVQEIPMVPGGRYSGFDVMF
jgi:acylphosphatase